MPITDIQTIPTPAPGELDPTAPDKYFFLKIKNSLFDLPEVGDLLSIKQGPQQMLMYLQLCLKTIKYPDYVGLVGQVGTDGVFRGSTTEQIRRQLIYYSTKQIEAAISNWIIFGLATYAHDSILYLTLAPSMVLSDSKDAIRKRKKRAEDKNNHDSLEPDTPSSTGASAKPAGTTNPTDYTEYAPMVLLTENEYQTLIQQAGGKAEADSIIQYYSNWKTGDSVKALERQQDEYKYKDYSYMTRNINGWLGKKLKDYGLLQNSKSSAPTTETPPDYITMFGEE